jgi:hypothetical protein
VKTYIRIPAILAAALAAIGLAGAAHAAAGPVDLSIVNRDTGEVLRTWRHDGRLFVVGQPGARYSLRVTNHTDGRVLVVMSVDGVNILTGESADYGQRGYVFDAHESYDVTGWRKSNTQVAAFTFAPLSQSYAARTGRPADVGVIGMAVFREKVEVPPPEPQVSPSWRDGQNDLSRGNSDAARSPDLRRAIPSPPPPPALIAPAQRAAAAPPSSKAYTAGAGSPAPSDERLGTGHGAREWSAISVVDFERATAYPQFIRQIEYDTYAHLLANGVIEPSDTERHPRPFPTRPDGAGYVPDPPDER